MIDVCWAHYTANKTLLTSTVRTEATEVRIEEVQPVTSVLVNVREPLPTVHCGNRQRRIWRRASSHHGVGRRRCCALSNDKVATRQSAPSPHAAARSCDASESTHLRIDVDGYFSLWQDDKTHNLFNFITHYACF